MIVASPPTLNEGEYGAGNEQQQPEPRKRSIGGRAIEKAQAASDESASIVLNC